MKLKKYLGKAFIIGTIAGATIAMGAVSAYAKTITYDFLADDCTESGVDLFGEDGEEITESPEEVAIKDLERAVKVNHNKRCFPDDTLSEFGLLKFSEATNLDKTWIPIRAKYMNESNAYRPFYIAVKAKKGDIISITGNAYEGSNLENKFVMYKYAVATGTKRVDPSGKYFAIESYIDDSDIYDTQSTTDPDYTLSFKAIDEAGVYLILNRTTGSDTAAYKSQYLSELTIEEAPNAEITQLGDKKYNIKIKNLNKKYPISKISIVRATSASEEEFQNIKKLKVDNLENPTTFEFDCEFITLSDLKFAKVKLECGKGTLYYNLTD